MPDHAMREAFATSTAATHAAVGIYEGTEIQGADVTGLGPDEAKRLALAVTRTNGRGSVYRWDQGRRYLDRNVVRVDMSSPAVIDAGITGFLEQEMRERPSLRANVYRVDVSARNEGEAMDTFETATRDLGARYRVTGTEKANLDVEVGMMATLRGDLSLEAFGTLLDCGLHKSSISRLATNYQAFVADGDADADDLASAYVAVGWDRVYQAREHASTLGPRETLQRLVDDGVLERSGESESETGTKSEPKERAPRITAKEREALALLREAAELQGVSVLDLARDALTVARDLHGVSV